MPNTITKWETPLTLHQFSQEHAWFGFQAPTLHFRLFISGLLPLATVPQYFSSSRILKSPNTIHQWFAECPSSPPVWRPRVSASDSEQVGSLWAGAWLTSR